MRIVADGRTLRKIRRFANEVRTGCCRDRRLKPYEMMVRVQYLIERGYPIHDLMNLRRIVPCDYDEETMIAIIKEIEEVTNFCMFSYMMAGVRVETLINTKLFFISPYDAQLGANQC